MFLAALRLNPEAFRAAPLIRALLIRGVFSAVVCSLAGLIISRFKPWYGAAGLCSGFALNAAATCALSMQFDEALLAAANSVEKQRGVITIVSPAGDPYSVMPAAGGNWVRAEPVTEVTPLAGRILCAAEDERCLSRQLPADPLALLRAGGTAVFYAVTGHHGALPGASDLAEQTGGLLLDLKPQGRGAEAWATKLRKTLAGVRVHDLFGTDEQVRLYLSLAPFGSLKGHEAVGLAAAARVFYGRDDRDLTAAQLAELMARLRNPNIYSPYAAGVELEAHRRRTAAILEVAHRKDWLSEAEKNKAKSEFLVGLLDRDTATQNLLVPRATGLIAEVLRLAGPGHSGHLVAETEVDGGKQRWLEQAIATGMREFTAKLPWGRHRGDEAEVDAVEIAPSGGIAATYGLARIPGGMASQLKPELYALAREHGIPFDPMALAKSVNRVALGLARRLGLSVYAKHLRGQDYVVSGNWEPIVLGAGVTGSPIQVAGNFAKFAYVQPGVRIVPDLIARLRDEETGQTLFEVAKRHVFRASTATEVRHALEMTSTKGTASGALRPLAEQAPIAAKTGTAGFFRRGRWQGEGGSWCVAADSVTKTVIAVRVRWRSGRPFELEGGKSAAWIVRHAIETSRAVWMEGKR